MITGRASVTRFDVSDVQGNGNVRLLAAHAETDAANLIPRAVTLAFAGPEGALESIHERLLPLVPAPVRLEPAGPSGVEIPPGAKAFQLIGVPAHGGSPHRGKNPVPAAIGVLRSAVEQGVIEGTPPGRATFTVDLRLPPEMELDTGLEEALGRVRAWAAKAAPDARVEAPPARCRPGYSLPPDHPFVRTLDRILRETLGSHGPTGEYGGTDASSLRGLRTSKGDPLPALVFGSMDPPSNIHEAEESADPRKIAAVARTIERFVREA